MILLAATLLLAQPAERIAQAEALCHSYPGSAICENVFADNAVSPREMRGLVRYALRYPQGDLLAPIQHEQCVFAGPLGPRGECPSDIPGERRAAHFDAAEQCGPRGVNEWDAYYTDRLHIDIWCLESDDPEEQNNTEDTP